MDDPTLVDDAYPSGNLRSNHPLARIGLGKRAAIWDACEGRCTYCGVQLHPFRTFTVDHRIPRSRGGTNALANLVGCCLDCNQAKADNTRAHTTADANYA